MEAAHSSMVVVVTGIATIVVEIDDMAEELAMDVAKELINNLQLSNQDIHSLADGTEVKMETTPIL